MIYVTILFCILSFDFYVFSYTVLFLENLL